MSELVNVNTHLFKKNSLSTEEIISLFDGGYRLAIFEQQKLLEFNSQKSKELVDKFLSKSELVWVNETIGDGENIVKEKFVLYDSSGIMIYIKEGVTLFILTTIDRYEVAKYSIGMLKRLK